MDEGFSQDEKVVELLTTIEMSMTSDQSIVLVEGPSDVTFLKKILDDNFLPLPCDNKEILLKVISSPSIDKTRIIAFADADFDRLLTTTPTPNVIYYDCHDLETMLITRGTLFNEFIETFFGQNPKYASKKNTYITTIFRIATEIGYLKLVSIKYNINLSFKYIKSIDKFDKFLNKKDFQFSIESLLDFICQSMRTNHNPPSLKKEEILSFFQTEKTINHNINEVMNGHDIVRLISYSTLAYIASGLMDELTISKTLTFKITIQDISNTQFFLEIKKLEKSINKKILKAT